MARKSREGGLSLIEILIGVAIGLIGIVMMFQLLENWEARKRTSSAGGDAQISGSIASYRLEQDIKQAGFGFGTADTRVGCTVSAYDSTRGATNFTFPMVPVQITDGAAGAPDTLAILYGNSPTMSASLSYKASTTTSKTMKDTRAGIRRGDLVIAAPSAAACGLIRVTGNTNVDSLTIDHINGTYTDEMNTPLLPTRFNDPAGYLGAAATGMVYNMGDSPSRNIWQIANGRILQARNDLLNGATADIAEGIVNLQAEYGLDTDNNTIVETWQATVPGTWSTLRAIRVAILARSQQYEKDANPATPAIDPVTTAAPAWAGGAFVMTNLDGTADSNPGDANDWRQYRYRVYETTIPLRNMVWGTAP